jgi:hypothetical protein
VFEYRLAKEVHAVFANLGVKYLFLGKSAHCPDSQTRHKMLILCSKVGGEWSRVDACTSAIGFSLPPSSKRKSRAGLIQLRDGPFDLDLIFAPTVSKPLTKHGPPRRSEDSVCHPDDIIASKKAAGGQKI